MCTVDTPHTLSVRRDPARKNVHDDTVHGNLKSGRLKSIVEGACHSVQQLLSRGLPRSSREREGAPGRSCTSYCSPSMGATPRSTQTSGQTGAAPSAQGLLPGTWMVRGGQAQGAPGPHCSEVQGTGATWGDRQQLLVGLGPGRPGDMGASWTRPASSLVGSFPRHYLRFIARQHPSAKSVFRNEVSCSGVHTQVLGL